MRVPLHTHRIRRSLRPALAALLIIATSPASSGTDDTDLPVLIIHPDITAEALPRHWVRGAFAMRHPFWENGLPLHVHVFPDHNVLHVRFTNKVLGVFPHQLRLAVDRHIFSGAGQAPRTVHSESEMLRRVSETPGAIGYVRHGRVNHAYVRIIPVQ